MRNKSRMRGGAYNQEGQRSEVAEVLRVACPKCDASAGQRCISWRRQDGVRLYVKGYCVKPHAERKGAA